MHLVQPLAHERHGELGAVHGRKVELREQMLYGSDVIQVPVCEEQSLDAVFSAFQRRDIRHEIIDAEHIFVGELQSQIDDDEIAIHVDDKAVTADLLEPAKRIELEATAALVLLRLLLRPDIRSIPLWRALSRALLRNEGTRRFPLVACARA